MTTAMPAIRKIWYLWKKSKSWCRWISAL